MREVLAQKKRPQAALCLVRHRAQRSAADLQQFHIELERGVRWNHAARAACTVAEGGRNDQGALATDLHALDAFVPALDDHARAQRELEGVVAVAAGVELGTLLAVDTLSTKLIRVTADNLNQKEQIVLRKEDLTEGDFDDWLREILGSFAALRLCEDKRA